MNIILAIGILLTIVSLKMKKYNPLIGFAFVFLIMGFQNGVEGDFMDYMEDYIKLSTSQRVDSRTFEYEPVFPYLMYFFSLFSPFWFFILVLSLFEVFVVERFVSRFSFGQYQFIAAILFFFTFNMMLLQMKALRQGFAIEMILLAVLIIDNQKRMRESFPAIIVVALAYFSHNSALVVVPILLLFYFAVRKELFLTKIGNGGLFPFIVLAIYLLFYYAKTTILNDYLIRFSLLSKDFLRLSSYFGEEELEYAFDISRLIVLYDAIIVFLVSWYFRYANSKMRVFCIASILAAFGDMLFFGIGSLPRIIMYLVVFNLVVYPAVALQIHHKYGKIWSLAFIVLLFGYAIKTSLPWILGMEDDRFGTYKFVFMKLFLAS